MEISVTEKMLEEIQKKNEITADEKIVGDDTLGYFIYYGVTSCRVYSIKKD